MIAWRRLVLGAAAVLACAFAVPALAVNHAPRRTDDQNHQAAIRDASRLVQRAVLPTGSAPSSQEPSNDGGVLARPALTIGVTNLVDDHAWWTVDEPMDSVFRYEKTHPPNGGSLDSTCGAGGGGQPQWTCVGFSFSPRAGILGVRELVVEMVARGDGTTAIRADSEVQWIALRPASEVVPAGVQAIRVSRAGGGRRVSQTVTNQATVAKIIRLFDALPVLQPGTWHCPAESGVPVRFAFRSAPDGPALARARVPSDVGPGQTGCDAMSFWIGHQEQPALVKARVFLRRVGQLLGVQLIQSRPRG